MARQRIVLDAADVVAMLEGGEVEVPGVRLPTTISIEPTNTGIELLGKCQRYVHARSRGGQGEEKREVAAVHVADTLVDWLRTGDE